jgi:hypothetical protein
MITEEMIKQAQRETVATRKRANTMTFVAGAFMLVYGLAFACIMPGINGTVLGSIIALFGILIVAFSIESYNNNK